MKLLNYFLFVLLASPLLLAGTSNLVAMRKEISLPGFRLIADFDKTQSSYASCQTAEEEGDSSDEEIDDRTYHARHKSYELEEKAEGADFRREQSARIRAEKKRSIRCSVCQTIHIIPETENFRLIQRNTHWTCKDICWQADKLFADGVAVCAATHVTIELEEKDDISLDSDSSHSGSDKENQQPPKREQQVIHWVACTHCLAWRRVPTVLIKSGKINMKKLARKKNWVCADATWKGPKGIACKR